jgi:MFS family permease
MPDHLRPARTPVSDAALGLRANLGQFVLLVVINAFVGAMVGLERSILPLLAEQEYGVVAATATFSFIVAFGSSKAATNYFAGLLGDRFGRRWVLIAGWVVAAPVPFLLMHAPTWGWIVGANVLLGISQGLTWSTTVIMKIDLVGPARRGFAMGLNEFAGYVALAASAMATGFIAERYGITPEPFYLGVIYVVMGLGLSLFFVRETMAHVHTEVAGRTVAGDGGRSDIFLHTTLRERTLSSVVQAGFVNNLNDGVAWGVFPLVFAASGASIELVGFLAALYPATSGFGQLVTGPLSDRIGRKPLIVWGMLVQGVGIGVIAATATTASFVVGSILLGVGTAMVYPTLLAAIGDVAHPSWRGSAVGVYRLWRDLGYVGGAVLAGLVIDASGTSALLWIVAALTAGSGIAYAARAR